MSTKKKPKKRPMRLWLVRDVDPTAGSGGDLWVVCSDESPKLTVIDDRYVPQQRGLLVSCLGSDLAPGECVELREVR